MNNEAQCPSDVPPTPCSDLMLMTPERNTSESQPSIRCYCKNLWQSRISIPSDLFRHLSNYRVECILIGELTDFYSLWCQWVDWGYTACESSVCYYRQGGDLQTHTLKTQGPILAGQVILEWQLRKEREEYFYLRLYTYILPSYPSPVAFASQFSFQCTGNASCPIIWKQFSELFKLNDSTLTYFSL